MDANAQIDVSKITDAWQDFVRQALSNWNTQTFSVRRTLRGGRSGAEVILVEIRTPRHDGLGILKISESDPPSEEHKRQVEARSLGPALATHIPVVTHEHCAGSRTAALMTVAGGGLLEAEGMATIGGARLYLASQVVSTSLLREWNPDPTFDGHSVNASALLREWLSHRLGPAARIPEVMRQIVHIPPDCPAFRYGGEDYPNPYGFADDTFIGSSITVSPARGLLHGDLHSDNVLISGQKVENYYFIDFAFFKNHAPLLFDHAYLELHLILTARETATHQRWHRLCQALVGLEDTRQVTTSDVDVDDHGVLWTAGMIRAEVFKWINTRYPERKEDLKKQLLLARIAAGLNYMNKRRLSDDAALSDKKKFFALLYAAASAKELFEYCRLTIRDDGPVAQPMGEMHPPSSNEWREVWEACGDFDSRRAAYVLVAGSEAGKLPEYARAILGRLPWSLVIDFDRTGPHGKLLLGAGLFLKRDRGFHQVFPHQSVTVDFETGTCWLFADSEPSNLDSAPLPLQSWRRITLPRVRDLAGALHRATVPRPIYLVTLGKSIDAVRLRNTFTALEEQLGGLLETVVVTADAADDTHDVLSQETRVCTHIIA